MERLSKSAANVKAVLMVVSLLVWIYAVVLNTIFVVPGLSEY